MRRVILAIASTAAGLVALLSFKTHTPPSLASASPSVKTNLAPGGTGSGSLAGSGSAATATMPGSTAPGSTASGSTASGSPSKAASRPGSPAPSAAASRAPVTETVTGAEEQTMYGPVQVQITVTDGKITAASATEYPQDTPRDQQINSYAIPQLNQEAVAADSAKIDSVSGASYTSGGYISSLQSAVDKAGL